jgi:hypothetical protein
MKREYSCVMSGEMIALKITDGELNSCDISAINRNFGRSIEPKMAKAVYGRICLIFPKYDKDPREVWEIEDVRNWFRKVMETVPHFPFFMVPDAAAGQLSMYLLSILQIQRDQSGQVMFDPHEAEQELSRIDRALVDFCRLVREDYSTVSSRLFAGLAEPLRGLLP